MTSPAEDPLLDVLRGLPRALPDAALANRIRSRSHAILVRQCQPRKAKIGLAARVLDAAVAVVCLIYFSGAVAQAWRLFSAIR